jgi:replicative DNA helicase
MEITLNLTNQILAYTLAFSLAVNIVLTIKFVYVRIGNTNKSKHTVKNVGNSNVIQVNGDFIQTIQEVRGASGPAYDEAVSKLEEKSRAFENDEIDLSVSNHLVSKDHNTNTLVKTGFTDLDNGLDNIEGAQLVVLSAVAGEGRTTLALDMLRHNAVVQNIPVWFFSMGMSSNLVTDRLISAEARVAIKNLRDGRMVDSDFEAVTKSVEKLSLAPVFIDDSMYSSLSDIRHKILGQKSEVKNGIIVIDGVELLDEYRQDFEGLLVQLKRISSEIHLPIFVTIPMPRKPVMERGGYARLTDLPDAVSQISDVVIIIEPRKVDYDHPEIKEITVLKNRNGWSGRVELYHDLKYMTFLNLERAIPAPSDDDF